jgi:uncharacterized protein YciI
MFVILLNFADNRSSAPQHMDGHKAWIEKGFEDGVFLLAGNLEPGRGGAILAQSETLFEIQKRVNLDPFVEYKVVSAEIFEIKPGRADGRLQFLL